MTFSIGYVEGGTNAGRRIVKPTPKPWACACRDAACKVPCDDVCPSCIATRKTQPAYMSRCPDCGTRRDG